MRGIAQEHEEEQKMTAHTTRHDDACVIRTRSHLFYHEADTDFSQLPVGC